MELGTLAIRKEKHAFTGSRSTVWQVDYVTVKNSIISALIGNYPSCEDSAWNRLVWVEAFGDLNIGPVEAGLDLSQDES